MAFISTRAVLVLLSDKPTASGKGKKGKKGKGDTKKKRKPSTAKRDDSEAGEETDEGDMESQEMDYYSTTSSDEEEQRVCRVMSMLIMKLSQRVQINIIHNFCSLFYCTVT